MAAIHRRFRVAMLERLLARLGNVQGEAALLGADSSVAAEVVSAIGEVTSLDAMDAMDALDGRRWESLICVAEIWRLPDLSRLSEALTDQGRLFFVEPVSAFGLARRAQSLSPPITRRWLGLDFECDVPQALRDVGLTPTSTDRFRVGGPVFTFVAGEARQY